MIYKPDGSYDTRVLLALVFVGGTVLLAAISGMVSIITGQQFDPKPVVPIVQPEHPNAPNPDRP